MIRPDGEIHVALGEWGLLGSGRWGLSRKAEQHAVSRSGIPN
jgi:hypothetical protein